jgi:hypothetical protein
MANDDAKKKRLPALGLAAITLLSFSNLFTFGDRISSKPTEAGFWMILLFGVCLGACAAGLPLLLRKQGKKD